MKIHKLLGHDITDNFLENVISVTNVERVAKHKYFLSLPIKYFSHYSYEFSAHLNSGKSIVGSADTFAKADKLRDGLVNAIKKI